jgi:hypothetical protein
MWWDDSVHITYRQGGWFGIVGEQLLVLLPPGSKRKALAVWEVVDEGAAFDQVLDLVISNGLRDLPGLVVIGVSGDTTRVLVRGSATATFDTRMGPVTVDGTTAWTWVERTLAGVTTMSVLLEHAATSEGGEQFTVDRGLVRLGALSHPAVGAPPAPVAPQADDTEAAVPAVEELTEPVGLAPVPAFASSQAPRILLSTGEEYDVDRPLVVGRAPVARRIFSDEEPVLVTVPSPAHEISSTHLELRTGPEGKAVVTDLGSTNGTVLVQPGVAPEDLRPGYPVTLVKGAIIDLGDGVTIKVIA